MSLLWILLLIGIWLFFGFLGSIFMAYVITYGGNDLDWVDRTLLAALEIFGPLWCIFLVFTVLTQEAEYGWALWLRKKPKLHRCHALRTVKYKSKLYKKIPLFVSAKAVERPNIYRRWLLVIQDMTLPSEFRRKHLRRTNRKCLVMQKYGMTERQIRES